ncbi:MAG: sigma-70 family RNA polymerase sigma factor [Myxococcaceae bacterium]
MTGDRQLLERARAGDASALDDLLHRYEKPVFRFGLRMCGSEEDAKDVLQETLVAAFKGLPEFRGDAELSTWLFQIARSFCVKARRKPAGAPAQLAPLDAPEARGVASELAGPDAKAHAREIGDVLQAAIRALPDDWREVVVLKDVEGLSAEEMAKVLGEDVAAVKSRLHRARLQLRENLDTLLGADDPANAPCPELASELAGFAAQEIDQAACVRIEAHLRRCPRCRAACDSLQRTVSLCRRIPGDEVPAAVRTAVRHALAAALR